jgi:hypothetical protein
MYPEQSIAYNVPPNGQAPRPPQIALECEMLGGKVELLLKQLTELTERLGGIMRPMDRGPQAEENPIKQAESLAPHASFLRQQNLMIERATDMVASILSRIEI